MMMSNQKRSAATGGVSSLSPRSSASALHQRRLGTKPKHHQGNTCGSRVDVASLQCLQHKHSSCVCVHMCANVLACHYISPHVSSHTMSDRLSARRCWVSLISVFHCLAKRRQDTVAASPQHRRQGLVFASILLILVLQCVYFSL